MTLSRLSLAEILSTMVVASAFGPMSVGQVGCSDACPSGTMPIGKVCKRIGGNLGADSGTGDAVDLPLAGGISGTTSRSASGSGGLGGDTAGISGKGDSPSSAGRAGAYVAVA